MLGQTLTEARRRLAAAEDAIRQVDADIAHVREATEALERDLLRWARGIGCRVRTIERALGVLERKAPERHAEWVRVFRYARHELATLEQRRRQLLIRKERLELWILDREDRWSDLTEARVATIIREVLTRGAEFSRLLLGRDVEIQFDHSENAPLGRVPIHKPVDGDRPITLSMDLLDADPRSVVGMHHALVIHELGHLRLHLDDEDGAFRRLTKALHQDVHVDATFQFVFNTLLDEHLERLLRDTRPEWRGWFNTLDHHTRKIDAFDLRRRLASRGAGGGDPRQVDLESYADQGLIKLYRDRTTGRPLSAIVLDARFLTEANGWERPAAFFEVLRYPIRTATVDEEWLARCLALIPADFTALDVFELYSLAYAIYREMTPPSRRKKMVTMRDAATGRAIVAAGNARKGRKVRVDVALEPESPAAKPPPWQPGAEGAHPLPPPPRPPPRASPPPPDLPPAAGPLDDGVVEDPFIPSPIWTAAAAGSAYGGPRRRGLGTHRPAPHRPRRGRKRRERVSYPAPRRREVEAPAPWKPRRKQRRKATPKPAPPAPPRPRAAAAARPAPRATEPPPAPSPPSPAEGFRMDDFAPPANPNQALRDVARRVQEELSRAKSATRVHRVQGRMGAASDGQNDDPTDQFEPLRQILELIVDPVAERRAAASLAPQIRVVRGAFSRIGERVVQADRLPSGRRVGADRLIRHATYGEPRLFGGGRIDTVESFDQLHVSVMVDTSGSMGTSQRLERARSLGRILAGVFRDCPGIETRFAAWSDALYWCGDHEAVALSGLEPCDATNEAAAIDHVVRQPIGVGRAPVLVAISDGLPTTAPIRATARVLREAERRGWRTLLVGVHDLAHAAWTNRVDVLTMSRPELNRLGSMLARLAS